MVWGLSLAVIYLRQLNLSRNYTAGRGWGLWYIGFRLSLLVLGFLRCRRTFCLGVGFCILMLDFDFS
jgi:hypothetical protein